jgi:hypothetical protein
MGSEEDEKLQNPKHKSQDERRITTQVVLLNL